MLLVQTSTRANTAKSSPSIQTILKLDAIQCNPMQLSVTQKATQSTANINALHSSNILLNAHNIIFHKEGFYPNCLRLPEHLGLDVIQYDPVCQTRLSNNNIALYGLWFPPCSSFLCIVTPQDSKQNDIRDVGSSADFADFFYFAVFL